MLLGRNPRYGASEADKAALKDWPVLMGGI